MVIKSKSAEDTVKLGEEVGKRLKRGFFCLYGDLGAGKTTFVRGLAKGLGIRGRVQSPTFTYNRIYRNHRSLRSPRGRKLYHFDCYRLSKSDELFIHEVNEAQERGDGVIVIEWAQNIKKSLPKNRTDIYFEYAGRETRRIKLYDGPRSRTSH